MHVLLWGIFDKEHVSTESPEMQDILYVLKYGMFP